MIRRIVLVVALLVAARFGGVPGTAMATPAQLALGGQEVAPLADIVVRGENRDSVARTVVVRVDDRDAPVYADRVNEERPVPPGPFMLRLRLALLTTPRGRALDLFALRQVLAFAPAGDVRIETPALDAPPSLPQAAHGWFFGPAGAAPLAGFEAVGPTDPRVSGPAVVQVRRPGTDPILAWGTRLTRFAAALPLGVWHVTLWSEDAGEWETLPAVLEQRIRINGQDVVLFRRDAQTWIRQRYFAGRDREVNPPEPPFAALGAFRGGRVEAEVTVGQDGLVVELAGFPQAATQIAALVAEPAGTRAGAAAVEAARAARFAETWPVVAAPPAPPPKRAALVADTPSVVAAPGGIAVVSFTATTDVSAIVAPALTWKEGQPLPTRLLWGQWRWRRPAAGANGLFLSPAHLRADSALIPLRTDLTRPLTLLVMVPPETPPGRRRLSLRLAGAETSVSVEVLPVRLPPPRARIGVFLDRAPHLAALPEEATRQARCDLATLGDLGLEAVAPPLAKPNATGLSTFLADLRAAGPKPALGYTPLRGLAADDAAGAPQAVARAEQALRAEGLTPPSWAVADEPSASGTADIAAALARAVRAAVPDARLAGFLNDRADAALVPLLDVVAVNPSFGADAADIAELRAAHREPWLYNMPSPRLAAGFYLWRSGAAGMLQWHARMPSADAFDPTDGREGDVQFLWPAPEVCGAADLDADVLDLVEGAQDARWLAWLTGAAAAGQKDAMALARRLHADIPASWSRAAALPADQPARWRAEIIALARRLSGLNPS